MYVPEDMMLRHFALSEAEKTVLREQVAVVQTTAFDLLHAVDEDDGKALTSYMIGMDAALGYIKGLVSSKTSIAAFAALREKELEGTD